MSLNHLEIAGRLLVLAIGLAMTFNAHAAELDAPTGDIILTVTGAIANTNAEGAASFDLEMLEALPQMQSETTTIWTDGNHTFSGVGLPDLLAALGSGGKDLKATAVNDVNDYAVEIPTSDAVKGGPVVAYPHGRRGHVRSRQGTSVDRLSL